jgi:hypothetical protein
VRQPPHLLFLAIIHRAGGYEPKVVTASCNNKAEGACSIKASIVCQWDASLASSKCHVYSRAYPGSRAAAPATEKHSHLRLTAGTLFSISTLLKSFFGNLHIVTRLAEIGSNGQRRLKLPQGFLKVPSAQVNSADIRMYGRVAGLKR